MRDVVCNVMMFEPASENAQSHATPPSLDLSMHDWPDGTRRGVVLSAGNEHAEYSQLNLALCRRELSSPLTTFAHVSSIARKSN